MKKKRELEEKWNHDILAHTLKDELDAVIQKVSGAHLKPYNHPQKEHTRVEDSHGRVSLVKVTTNVD